MSISVKNIAVSIGGTNSDKFKIKLDGALYHLDNFRMEQRLLHPVSLSFTLFKDPIEDIKEPQFSICKNLIGQEVKLTLQTEPMEKEISNANTDGKTADIEFEGFITHTNSDRTDSRQAIAVKVVSKDATLAGHPTCQVFNEEPLANIVKAIYEEGELDTQEVKPEKEETIFYTAEYNESHYDFLRRMARRHCEWFFSTGTALHFGKLENSENIKLTYPSKDIPDYGVRLHIFHPSFYKVGLGYNTSTKSHAYTGDYKEDCGNPLSDAALKASNDNYAHKSQQITAGSMESESDIEKEKIEPPLFCEDQRAEMLSQRSDMLIYEGHTYCSRLKIGAKLCIRDNYINNSDSSTKSEVQQDEILITEVIHTFKADERYKNSFKGITAAHPFPPYEDDSPIYPVCNHPIIADVVDTEDPKHWGRVKVRFPWQRKKFSDGDKNGTTPWVHVVQPYEFPNGGLHLIPEKWSEVLVNFEEGNFERPQVIGTRFTPRSEVDEKWYDGNENLIKAIRTASGHTIEIHDVSGNESGGSIRIYDNSTHNYDILFDTDKKLISLHSKGNIELRADRDIVMNAGRNMKIIVGKPKDGYRLDDGDSGSFLLNVENYYYNYVGFEQRVKAERLSMLTTDRRRVKAPTYILNAEEYNVEVHSEMSETPGSFITATDSELVIRSDGDVKVRSRNNLNLYGGTNVNITANFEAKLTGSESVSISGTTSVTVKGLQIELN